MNTPSAPGPKFKTATELPTLAAKDLKDVYCKVCAGVFDLSETGVFPEHFFNFRSLRKLCGASGKRYAHVKGAPARKPTAPATPVPTTKQTTNRQAPTPNYPVIRLTQSGKAQCPACDRMLTPSLNSGTLPVHKNDGKRCRMSNRKFQFLRKKGKHAKKQSPTVQHYAEKYKVRSTEEIQKERKRTQLAQDRKRERTRQRRRRQRHSDNYALDCHDSWGQDDHSIDEGVSVRTYRGGLPGLGKGR